MKELTKEEERIVIKFVGDSGDGMQLTGNQFAFNTVLSGHDIVTFPDFPAEIRAPQGTVAGVSGYQIHFGSTDITTPGEDYDVLVAMNAAALKSNIKSVKPHGIIITDPLGFDPKNLKLANYLYTDPSLDPELKERKLIQVDITKLCLEAVKEIDLPAKEKDRSKNMVVLGLVYWMFNRDIESSIRFLETRFAKDPIVLKANLLALKAGYNYGETAELLPEQIKIKQAHLPKGIYRSIIGNDAIGIGLVVAASKAGMKLFYGTYPITPASDILHFLSKQKKYGVMTFQAEDEIAAICSAIGASYGGNLGTCGTSGPGMALKAEALGLAISTELPLVVCNIQRAGPSTGMPTKTEQADLLQALYGRNGESPLPVIAPISPSDCFFAAFEAAKIALEHMTPVILLSDLSLANGSEPWKFPSFEDLESIVPPYFKGESDYQPYERDENLVRNWALPGTKNLEHRIGGLEKEDITGNVSYDPENHFKMIQNRQGKIDKIQNVIAPATSYFDTDDKEILLITWGSSFGSVKSACVNLRNDGIQVNMIQLRWLNPLPKNLKEICEQYALIIVAEMNNGQLSKVLRDAFLLDFVSYGRPTGKPLKTSELESFVKSQLTTNDHR